jgi:hypothetical protein
MLFRHPVEPADDHIGKVAKELDQRLASAPGLAAPAVRREFICNLAADFSQWLCIQQWVFGHLALSTMIVRSSDELVQT